MIKHIHINIIPHKLQRYNTPGDYYFDESGDLIVNISDTGDDFANELILIHELVEEMLTRKRGITEPEIMAFDELYEKERAEGKHTADEEPGWDDRCPCKKEHSFAEAIERLCANEVGLDWNEYDKKVMNVWKV
jgi:hypothetical protein